MLSHYKQSLTTLIENDQLDEVFVCLKKDMEPGTGLRLELTNHISKWKSIQSDIRNNLISHETQSLEKSRLVHAVQGLIAALDSTDFSPSFQNQLKEHKAIPTAYQYRCDRIDQNDAFKLYHKEHIKQQIATDQKKKVYFFNLYGDNRQSHFDLIQRFGYELGGFPNNYLKGDFDPRSKIKFIQVFAPSVKNEVLFKHELKKELFLKVIPAKDFEPLENKKIEDILNHEDLASFGEKDFIFIHLIFNTYFWKRKLDVGKIQEFVMSFCKCEFDISRPQIMVFFGMEYKKKDQHIYESIEEIAGTKEWGKIIPLLTPVDIDDVGEWLDINRKVLPQGKEVEDLLEEWFEDKEEVDMKDVTPKLRELIEHYNKGLI